MLSHNDIRRALGKGIDINPFKIENVEGASIYLTASELAWLPDGTCIHTGNEIQIPKNNTGIIITNEIVRVDNKYAATCHARLRLTMKGLSYYPTAIKTGYKGKLIIFLQNNTNKGISINVDEPIVSVMFHRLLSKTSLPEKIESSPDAYLFRDGKIHMTPAQDLIYKTPNSHNEIDNNKRYEALKTDKSRIFDIIVTFGCTIAFIACLVLLFKLPSDKQNFKDIVQILSPFAGAGMFAFLGKLLRK
jgi:dUTPase